MNDIQIFNNPEFGSVRTVVLEDGPWFVGKDVAEILGYSNTNKAVMVHVDEDDKFLRDSRGNEMGKLFSSIKEMQDILGRQDAWLINESGLYSLVLSSKLPTAKKFKRWVTSEVLPTIRKYGAYMTQDALKKAIESPDFLIQLASKLKEEQQARAQAELVIEAQKPKVIFADAVSVSTDVMNIGELAKILFQNGVDIGRNRLMAWMRNHGYLIKGGRDNNTPTQRAMNLGLFKVKERTINCADGSVLLKRTSLVTGKGQQYFINKFIGKKELVN